MPTKCFLCHKSGEDVGIYPISSRDLYRIICPRCGEYKISDECLRYTPESNDAYLLSGLVRELNEQRQIPEFLTTNIETLKNSYPVPKSNDIAEKANKLLQRLKAKIEYFGQSTEVNCKNDYPLAYAKNPKEFEALIKMLEQKNLAHWAPLSNTDGLYAYKITLTANGWELGNKLGKENSESEQGFIAAWFDESMNESITAMEEAITEAGYMPVCIKDSLFPEKIMDKALGEIRKSRFVVVDLTGTRSSVFFEAGFAFGLNIETIYVCKDELPPEFYVRHYQCYKYSTKKELKEILINAIAARIKKK
ncbi:MAG: hypothetical protein V4524_03835 [Patescibacteria group bacterium]